MSEVQAVIHEIRRRLDAIEARLGPSKEDVKRERSIAAGLRFDILKRDGFRCTYCGTKGNRRELRVDHVVPVSKGGKSTPDNLTTACHPCNAGKSDKAIDANVVPIREPKRQPLRPAPKPREPELSVQEVEDRANAIMAMLRSK